MSFFQKDFKRAGARRAMPLLSPIPKFNFGLRIFQGCFFSLFLLFLTCASNFKFPQFDFAPERSDWRNFRGNQDGISNQYLKFDLPIEVLWRKKVGQSFSTPLILKKVVVLSSFENKLLFLELGSGRKLGSYSLSFPVTGTSCVEDSILYFAGGVENSYLYALNLKRGEVIWKKRVRNSSSSPIIVRERIYLGTERGELLCLKKIDGEEFWKFKAGGFIYSTPALSGDFLYFGSGDGKIYSLEVKTGKLIWSYRTNGGIYATPFTGEGLLFIGSADGYFYALDEKTGELLWKFETAGGVYSSATWIKGMVFFGSNDGYLYALSSRSGELLWKFKTDGPVHSSPIIIGDLLFFGSLDSYFYALKSSQGGLLFKYKTGGLIYASPSFSNGKILIPSSDSYLYCFGKRE